MYCDLYTCFQITPRDTMIKSKGLCKNVVNLKQVYSCIYSDLYIFVYIQVSKYFYKGILPLASRMILILHRDFLQANEKIEQHGRPLKRKFKSGS